MNKLLIAAAATFFALTTFLGAGAQAGFNMRLNAPAGFATLKKAGCGGGGYFRAYRKRSYRSVRRRSKPKVYAARKAAKAVSVAKVEEKAETKSAAVEAQNSSITTADGPVAKTAEAKPAADKAAESKKVAAAEDVGCKQFFPSVGMTLTVPCEQAQ